MYYFLHNSIGSTQVAVNYSSGTIYIKNRHSIMHSRHFTFKAQVSTKVADITRLVLHWKSNCKYWHY